VTRGALYHQFRDKADLFAAVAETAQAEVADRITKGAQSDGLVDPMTALHAGVRRFLEACADPAVERILLLDGPAVLGWQAWRDLADSYGLGLLQHALQAAIDAGAITSQPIEPLAHVLIGALDECALYVARTADPAAARDQCTAVLEQLLDGLTSHAGRRS
jgi:AcrR family transcriptional regulator